MKLVRRPAGAKPVRPRVSPPEPVAICLAASVVTQALMRRRASAWAVGNAATKLNMFRMPRRQVLSKAIAVPTVEGRGRDRVRRGVRPRHARQCDGTVTWEAQSLLERYPVARGPGDQSPTYGAFAGCTRRRSRTSARIEVGRLRGTTRAAAEGDLGVGGPHTSYDGGERAGGPDPAEQRRSVWR